jgi:pyruvate dehydrogenase E2 component (dihydrolipoamide acetyltransferase)
MDVLMPQLGETVSEGRITQWFKAVGEAVKPGENLFEIETDKVSMEVPAITAGVLTEIRIPAGEVAPVGAVVAVIRDAAGEQPQAAPAAGSAPMPASSGPPRIPDAVGPASVARLEVRPQPFILDPFREVRTPERNYGPARLASGAIATPLARRLAGDAGIDLARVTGSGPRGRIVGRDVEAAITAKARPVEPAIARGPSAVEVKALYRDAPHEEVPLDAMRRAIAARLMQAKQTIPHFYLSLDIELDNILKLRAEANAAAPKTKDGTPAFKLTLTDFMIKAWALALQRVAAANAVWAEDRILRFRHSDIGVAVALEGGLLTPVIRQAELKTVTTISAEMKELAARARARRLMPEEYQGGSTTISNLGMHGISAFAGVINPPQATLLAIGAAHRWPVEIEGGGFRFASRMTVTLSCDHRVVDGALGAELLGAFKALIENPVRMLVS